REIQRVQDAFQAELETAADTKHLLELESSLAESQQARHRLEGELEAARRELEVLRSRQAARESELEARTRELQANEADVEQKIQALTEALTAESHQSAEQHAGESATRRSELEAELVQMKQTLVRLQKELEDAQKQRVAHDQSAAADNSRLNARTK